MAFKMSFDKTTLKRPEPVPNGIYELRLIGFEPVTASSGESTNLYPVFEFVAPGEKYDAKKLKYAFVGNSLVPQLLQDMTHALGELMEEDPDPNMPDSMPGIFDTDKLKFNPKDPSTWVYSGPLLNKTLKAELYMENCKGRDSNKVLRFFCAIPNCAERFPKIQHSENMNWSSKKA